MYVRRIFCVSMYACMITNASICKRMHINRDNVQYTYLHAYISVHCTYPRTYIRAYAHSCIYKQQNNAIKYMSCSLRLVTCLASFTNRFLDDPFRSKTRVTGFCSLWAVYNRFSITISTCMYVCMHVYVYVFYANVSTCVYVCVYVFVYTV